VTSTNGAGNIVQGDARHHEGSERVASEVERSKPIFIVGAPRSGTTLLRFMLSSHSGIYIPPESDFIPRLFLGRPHTPLSRDEAARKLQVILSNRRFFREWNADPLDPKTFVAALPELTPAVFLHSLYSAYAAQYDAVRWGDKSPIYTNHMGLLADIFPDAQFIHLIRDGRDAALSVLDAYPDRFYVDAYFAARSWRQRVQSAREAGTTLGPERYLELRYEELTIDPEGVLSNLCHWLDEPFEPAMCEPHKLGRQLLRPRGRHAPVRQPPRPNSGRWRHRMVGADQRLFQAVAGDLLGELGYEAADTGRMSIGELLRRGRLATKYHVLEGGRGALQTFGIFHPH
jgi:Sulfotransferase family